MSKVFILISSLLLFGCRSETAQKEPLQSLKSDQSKPLVEGKHETKAVPAVAKAVPVSQPVATETLKQPVVTEPLEQPVAEKKEVAAKEQVKPKKKKTQPKKKKVAARPIIVFEDIRHDFDTLIQGEKYNHKFKFKNTGNADLEISKAKGSCGCTQPSFPFIGIPPGEVGYIGVEYNSVGKELDQSATIEVQTNAQTAPFILYLTGHVKAKEKEKPEAEQLKEVQKDSIN